MSKTVKKIPAILLLAFCIYNVYYLFEKKDVFQWDFKTYYYSAKAFLYGSNPYDIGQLSDAAGEGLKQHYAYSPMSNWFFAPFTILSFPAAYNLYLILKIAVLILLILLWRKHFLDGKTDILFYVFVVFGFSSAVYLDFRSGNISVFEQAVIWLSFYFLLKNKNIYFCLLIVLVSLFKLTPILFLALLPILGRKHRWSALGISVCAFLSLLFVNYLIWPGLFVNWIHNALSFVEEGSINPTTFSMMRELTLLILQAPKSSLSLVVALFTYGIIVLAVATVSWILIRRIKNQDNSVYEMTILFLTCVTFAIVIPRFKDYSYILLIPPSYFIIRKGIKSYFALIIVLILSRDVYFESGVPIANFLWEYYNVFLMYLIWGLFLVAYWRSPVSSVADPPLSGIQRLDY